MKKVLIVDGSGLIREFLDEILEMGKYKIVGVTASGLDAVTLYKELNPDIVTMDILIPDIDGVELIKTLKQYDNNAKIIILSPSDQKTKIKDAISAGVVSYIIRPDKNDCNTNA